MSAASQYEITYVVDVVIVGVTLSVSSHTAPVSVQDDHVADVAGTQQVYTAQDYVGRFALPYDAGSIGFGQSSDEVGAGTWETGLLLEYLDAVHTRTVGYLDGLTADELDRVVDDRWDPPVTLGARLVSVVNDDLQHVGQAAYVRGLLGR